MELEICTTTDAQIIVGKIGLCFMKGQCYIIGLSRNDASILETHQLMDPDLLLPIISNKLIEMGRETYEEIIYRGRLEVGNPPPCLHAFCFAVLHDAFESPALTLSSIGVQSIEEVIEMCGDASKEALETLHDHFFRALVCEVAAKLEKRRKYG